MVGLSELVSAVSVVGAIVACVAWIGGKLGAHGERIAKVETKVDMIARNLGIQTTED